MIWILLKFIWNKKETVFRTILGQGLWHDPANNHSLNGLFLVNTVTNVKLASWVVCKAVLEFLQPAN